MRNIVLIFKRSERVEIILYVCHIKFGYKKKSVIILSFYNKKNQMNQINQPNQSNQITQTNPNIQSICFNTQTDQVCLSVTNLNQDPLSTQGVFQDVGGVIRNVLTRRTFAQGARNGLGLEPIPFSFSDALNPQSYNDGVRYSLGL